MTTATATLTIRQTHLRHLEEHCPAMAYSLSVLGRDTGSGSGAYRGQAVHEFHSRYARHLYETGRETHWSAVPGILAEVYQEFPALTFKQRMDVKQQAEIIAQTFLMRQHLYYGSEEPFTSEIPLPGGSCTVTGRIDYLEWEDETARIVDVKSNHQIIPDARVREDFQLRTYAMLVLDNIPGLEAVEGRLLLSRYGIYLPQKGTALFTREDTDAFREHLSCRLADHFSGRLRNERIPGTWCQYCPEKRPGRCSLYRSYHGTTPPPPANEREAVKLARQVIALENARETRLALLKEYVSEHGPLSVGSSDAAEVFDFHVSEGEDFDAGEFYSLLYSPEVVSIVGEQPLDDFFTVKKTGKRFKDVRHRSEASCWFDDIARPTKSTRFGHRSVNGDE